MKPIEKQSRTITASKSIVIPSTVICYIIFSVIKRWGNNDHLFWIPLILSVVNVTILLQIFISKNASLVNNKFWFYAQLLLNIALAVLISTFLYEWG